MDADPTGNTATSIGPVDGCVEKAVGDQFSIDIYVAHAQDLAAWELRFAFDHQVIQIVGHDFGLFLFSTPPSGSIYPLFDQEKAYRFFLGAAEAVPTSPDSGSGVLARLTLQAIAPGTSPATIVSQPAYFSPRITDGNGYKTFDGPIANAAIAVDESCTPPAVTPSPSPSPEPGGEQGETDLPPPPAALTDTAPPETQDTDNDGYSNSDEADNSTDPLDANSTPPDNDSDFISDLNDPDDNNDGIPDADQDESALSPSFVALTDTASSTAQGQEEASAIAPQPGPEGRPSEVTERQERSAFPSQPLGIIIGLVLAVAAGGLLALSLKQKL